MYYSANTFFRAGCALSLPSRNFQNVNFSQDCQHYSLPLPLQKEIVYLHPRPFGGQGVWGIRLLRPFRNYLSH